MTETMSCRSDKPFSPSMAGFEPFSESKKRSRIKARRRRSPGLTDFCPQCGQFWGHGAGVKPLKKNSSGVPAPCRAQKHAFSVGSEPQKGV